jgi:indolepyruvate ferredoxin oxidoreductase beta subunit
MAQIADESGSVISAVLFGALAGSGALPFARPAFEETIARGGVGVAASRRAFDAGFASALGREATPASARARASPTAPSSPRRRRRPRRRSRPCRRPPAHRDRAIRRSPRSSSACGRASGRGAGDRVEGLRRTIDWQDVAHARLYLDRLDRVVRRRGVLAAPAAETARHLALWMTYEDTIRVAALKTRATRFERVHGEVRVGAGQVLAIDEYLHPRVQEICETLPAGLARWLERPGWPRALVERWTEKGKVVTTSSLSGFLLLYAIAGLRRFRRKSVRFAVEAERIDAWLAEIVRVAALDPALAVEVAQCQRLVKGYGDTHERGWRNFGVLMGVVGRAGAALAPATLAELRDAALADEHGHGLAAALRRHALA